MTDTIRRLSSIGASTPVILTALAVHAQPVPAPTTPDGASATVGE